MSKYGFSLTSISLFKDRIEESVLIWEMRVRGNPFSGIFYAIIFTVNVYKLPINILKSCIDLNSLTSVFGDITHIQVH